jgi:RNA ligase (TIGR02306 family)
MERKLASVRKITDLKQIDGADNIELAIVDGWQVVVAKNVQHKIGDFVVYCEIDSFLPIKEEFEFLRKTSYKKMGELEGFRLKTIRLRQQLSQGLILPISVLNSKFNPDMVVDISKQPWGDQLQVGPYDDALVVEVGMDVTELLGIVKYEPPIPAELSGKVKGMFPSFISKTDEIRIQNIPDEYKTYTESNDDFYFTEKLDGSSATFYINNGEFGVCSRNLELLETEGNTFWKVARQLDLENKMKAQNKNFAIQGELIGEGIQGNPYNIKGHTVMFFTAFDIDMRKRFNYAEFAMFMARNQLEVAPLLSIRAGTDLPKTIEELLKFAEDKSSLNEKTEREGVVIRTSDNLISFKAISNKFLLKDKN